MTRNMIATGAALGMAVSAVALVAAKSKSAKAKSVRRKAGKAIKAIGSAIDDISYIGSNHSLFKR